ncbi:MAG: hypothetical protein U0167_00340, partial [bacterium]
MTPQDIATIGVRVLGLGVTLAASFSAFACGYVRFLSWREVSRAVPTRVGDYDTYFLLGRTWYDSLVPSLIGVGVGVLVVV